WPGAAYQAGSFAEGLAQHTLGLPLSSGQFFRSSPARAYLAPPRRPLPCFESHRSWVELAPLPANIATRNYERYRFLPDLSVSVRPAGLACRRPWRRPLAARPTHF